MSARAYLSAETHRAILSRNPNARARALEHTHTNFPYTFRLHDYFNATGQRDIAGEIEI